MADVEGYVNQVCRSLSGSQALRRHIRDELSVHLTEAIEANRAAGMSEEQAAAKAIDQFGQPESVRQGLEAIYGRSHVALLIDKAMEWKEQTMKTGWKWRFVAHMAVVLLLTLQALFIIAMFIFIFPKVVHGHVVLEEQPQDYLVLTWDYLWSAYNTWFIWLPVIIVGWALFEWKCRSENKSMIRLAVGTWVSFAMMVVAFFVSAVLMLSLSMFVFAARDQ